MAEIVVGRDADDLKKYQEEGTILLGKHIVGTGEEVHMTTPLMLDVLRPHVIVLTGKRGSGKSYGMGVMIEELTKLPNHIRKNLCTLVIDTQGIFWTMKTPNDKEYSQLVEWGLAPRNFSVYVYVPEGQAQLFEKAGVEYDGVFSIKPSQLSVDDWLSVFGLEANDPLGILLQRISKKLGKDYSLDDIVSAIEKEEGFENTRIALQGRFSAAKEWGVFGEEGMPEILEPGKITVVDVSLTPQSVRSLLVAIVCKRLFEERVKARRKEELAETSLEIIKKTPQPWIFVDEANNFFPHEGKTAATNILSTLVREGRQPGITLVFATQQPYKLNEEALSQADLIVSYSLTSREDIDALKGIMQTYAVYDIGKYINELPKVKGAGIILDDNSERIYKIRIRARQSWHAGSSPVAI